MSKNKLQVVLCRTCVRDNPGQGMFQDFELNSKAYQSQLKAGLFKKHADLKYKNCFAQCENFHCVQVTKNGEGFLLKKISTPEQVQNLIEWVKEAKEHSALSLPKVFQTQLVAPVSEIKEKYQKI